VAAQNASVSNSISTIPTQTGIASIPTPEPTPEPTPAPAPSASGYTPYTDQQIADFFAQNPGANVAQAEQQYHADPDQVNRVIGAIPSMSALLQNLQPQSLPPDVVQIDPSVVNNQPAPAPALDRMYYTDDSGNYTDFGTTPTPAATPDSTPSPFIDTGPPGPDMQTYASTPAPEPSLPPTTDTITQIVSQGQAAGQTPTEMAASLIAQGIPAADVIAVVGPQNADVVNQAYAAAASDYNGASSGYDTAAQGGLMGYARGGIASMGQAQYLQGTTDGMADKLPTSIDGVRPAKLSHGEFVVPADVVSHLGNGNSDAGAKKLYQMMDRIRMDRTGTKKQGREINPDKYMPGGKIGYAGGGAVAFEAGGGIKGFDGTTGSAVNSNLGTSAAGVPGLGATQSNTLSPWAGDYVTNMLGKAQALTNGPMPVYQGPLSAGQSALQNQQFAGLSEMAQTGYNPATFTSGTFDANQAQQYMNPYLSASLAPQLSELQRQAQIGNANDASKLTSAGAYGGGRQAVLMGEQNRNLLDKSNQLIGQGYNTAYSNAMSQFNADQARQAAAQQNTEASRQFSANTGIKTLDMLGQAGATQRDIAQQGVAADLGQYKEQQAYPYQQLQFQQSMLQGLPISSAVSTANTTPMSTLAGNLAGYTGLSESLANLGLSK
jgi:hypothetical protein